MENNKIMNYSYIKDDFEMDKNNYKIIDNYLEIINDFENISSSRIPSFVKEYDIPTKKKQILSYKNIDAEKAGEIFKKKLFNFSKYDYFSFISHKTIDLYKIPYTFIKEFVYYSQFKYLDKITKFNLIDQFYGKIKLFYFNEINNKQKELELEKEKKKNKNKKEIDWEEELLKEAIKEKFFYMGQKKKINIYFHLIIFMNIIKKI